MHWPPPRLTSKLEKELGKNGGGLWVGRQCRSQSCTQYLHSLLGFCFGTYLSFGNLRPFLSKQLDKLVMSKRLVRERIVVFLTIKTVCFVFPWGLCISKALGSAAGLRKRKGQTHNWTGEFQEACQGFRIMVISTRRYRNWRKSRKRWWQLGHWWQFACFLGEKWWAKLCFNSSDLQTLCRNYGFPNSNSGQESE